VGGAEQGSHRVLYAKTTTDRISRFLVMFNMKKKSNTLEPLKYDLGLTAPGVYCILCECSKVYVRQATPSRQGEVTCMAHVTTSELSQQQQSTVQSKLKGHHGTGNNNKLHEIISEGGH
jgi:hypothetical protein